MRFGWGIFVGGLGGLVSGLFGLGGAFLVVPLLRKYGWQSFRAQATALFVMAAGTCAATGVYMLHHEVNIVVSRDALVMAPLGGVLGAYLMPKIRHQILYSSFGGFLVVSMLYDIFYAKSASGHPLALLVGVPPLLKVLSLAFVAGVMNGLLGIGGGLVLVPGFELLMGVAPLPSQGIALVVTFVTSSVSAVTHYRLGHIRKCDLKFLVPGALGGGILGAVWANQYHAASFLRNEFVVVTLVLGGYMLFGGPATYFVKKMGWLKVPPRTSVGGPANSK